MPEKASAVPEEPYDAAAAADVVPAAAVVAPEVRALTGVEAVEGEAPARAPLPVPSLWPRTIPPPGRGDHIGRTHGLQRKHSTKQ